jgi:pimeloyl-ACP methyl ester carboxylesterase
MPRKYKQTGNVAPPSIALLALEPLRAAADYCVSLLGSLPRLQGDGHPVLVLPGLAAGDWSTLRLRSVLKHAGFDAHAWGLGINRGPQGDLHEWLGGLEHKVRELHGRSGGRKVSLVGWSLGGIYARELAKRVPELVRQVITLGTPFADPLASHVGSVYRLLNGGDAQMTPQLARRLREDPPVPTTAIYSKTDGVVAWRACTSAHATRCENIEVSTASHCGMGTHPQVLRIVLERLAQPEGGWRRWQAPTRKKRRPAREHAYGG